MAVVKSGKSREIQDVLRLSVKECADLIAWLNSESQLVVTHERRLAERYPYRVVPRLAVLFENERPGKRTYSLIPRNISRTGMALLHGKFVYDGTICVLGLQALDGQVIPVRGKVVGCRLIRGRIHELGIRFDEPVEVSDYVPVS